MTNEHLDTDIELDRIQERRSDRDLLVRIDERVTQLSSRLKAVEEAINSRPCSANTEKLKTLERMVWGAYILYCVGFGTLLLNHFTGVK